jgi:hypothetical protein
MTLSNYRLRNEGLDPTLSNDRLKMRGWKRYCRVIGYKMRSGTDIVDLSNHFPMIGAQLCTLQITVHQITLQQITVHQITRLRSHFLGSHYTVDHTALDHITTDHRSHYLGSHYRSQPTRSQHYKRS